MGIRTTASDPVGFIYDSVTGLAIGECWEDEDEMEAFLKWFESEDRGFDIRKCTPEGLTKFRDHFRQHFWIKTSTYWIKSST